MQQFTTIKWLMSALCLDLILMATMSHSWNTDFATACATFGGQKYYDGWHCFASVGGGHNYEQGMAKCKLGDGNLLKNGELLITSGRSYIARFLTTIGGMTNDAKVRVGFTRISAEPTEFHGTWAFEDVHGRCAAACSASPVCVTFSHNTGTRACRLQYTEYNNTKVPPIEAKGFDWWER